MSDNTFNPISLDNPIFKSLILYSALLVLKMLGMSALTVLQRLLNKTSNNPEDAKMFNFEVQVNEKVERVRRAHQNDLENILVFFTASFFYIMTNPFEIVAVNLFRVYTAARFLHSFVYAILVIPQPARAITWVIGYAITGYMALITVWHFIFTSY